MKFRTLIPLTTYCLLSAVSLLGAADRPVITRLTLLVGQTHGGSAETAGFQLDSGTVIPLPEASYGLDSGRAELELPHDVPAKLKKTLPLEKVLITRALMTELGGGKSAELPFTDGTGEVAVELLSLGGDTATFRVVFREGNSVLNDSRIAVEMGKRAVVGALGTTSGEYLFLVVNPMTNGEIPKNPAKPLLLEMVMPRYAPADMAARHQGRVLVSGLVDRTGTPSALEILQTPADGLSESALEAIRQWRYQPAAGPDGKPVTVQLTWTLSFVLE